ncbi:MAG: hypothetical protein HXS54_18935 [Theionarchaea archaeon]|nr:hypothetical protein [Theionarchaea archaeon]
MKKDAVEIFEGDDDYKDWDKLILHCRTMDLTPLEKKMAQEAFQWLRKEFGEEFLNCAFETQHPICRYISNLAPWTRIWLIWFVETLKELKGTMRKLEYSQFKEKLKNSAHESEFRNNTQFGERIAVLRIAEKFDRDIFDISFDPEIRVSEKAKMPDLKLVEKDTGEEIFIEISTTHESEEERDVGQIMTIIRRNLVGFHQIWYSGRLKEKFSRERLGEELEEITGKVRKTIERVKKENRFQEVPTNNKIELGMAPVSDRKSLEKWAVRRGLSPTGRSIDYKTAEILRIKQKIRKKQDQLPRDRPSIVIIINDIFFLSYNTEKARRELLEELYKYPHLVFVIIAGRLFAPGTKAIYEEGDHYIFVDGTEERYFIQFNPSCKQRISHSTRTKILKCFRHLESHSNT